MTSQIKTFNKLVRDGILNSIRDEGRTPRFRVLDGLEFESALFAKLAEELQELRNARSAEEFGDVLEVLEALRKFYAIDPKLAELQRIEKRERSGAFDARIFLIDSD